LFTIARLSIDQLPDVSSLRLWQTVIEAVPAGTIISTFKNLLTPAVKNSKLVMINILQVEWAKEIVPAI